MKTICKPLLAALLFMAFFNAQSQVMPAEWEGKWEGVVNIWLHNVKKDSLPMSLEIARMDSAWTFEIQYLKDASNPDIRSYELIVIDSARYHLAVDEKNSIILDNFLNDNCLYGQFDVMSSDLQTRMCLVDGKLDYEITSYRAKPYRVSGTEVIENDTIPAVNSYRLTSVMRAILSKKE